MSVGSRRAWVFVSVLLASSMSFPHLVGSQEAPPPGPGAEAVEGGARAESSRERRRREVPSAMVLCRGPRGAVYARDVEDGCRNIELNASNLVLFGAGDGCLLRRAAHFDPERETTAAATTCDEVCAAAGDGDRTCVVGLRRDGATWTTFAAGERFPPGDAVLREASVACCKP